MCDQQHAKATPLTKRSVPNTPRKSVAKASKSKAASPRKGNSGKGGKNGKGGMAAVRGKK